MFEQYELRPFSETLIPAVQAFNGRLLAGGLDKALLYPDDPVPRFRAGTGTALHQEYYLICDGDGAMRGGFILTHEQWSFYGKRNWVAHLRLPLSEGVVDHRYKAVSAKLFESALERQPALYALGMGGFQNAYPKRIKSLGWSLAETPFYFRLFRPSEFLNTSPYLRQTPRLRLLSRIAAMTGIGAASIHTLQFLSGLGNSVRKDVCVDLVSEFGDWTDQVWSRCHHYYGLIAPRDRATLIARYPEEETRFLRLKFSRQGEAIGWAVLLDTRMDGNKYFGDARVGALVDYLASPDDAGLVIAGATDFLRARGVDLAVSNQMHVCWRRAFRRHGYLRGPSNYVFALSPKAAEMVHPFERNLGEFFVTRGDGAGRERLME